MNADQLSRELGLARQAELESVEQVRQLRALIEKATEPNSALSAVDCARLVAAALSVNDRLREHAKELQSKVDSAARIAKVTESLSPANRKAIGLD